ncbi:methyltransferase-like protein 13 [Olea europaea var. sylvestris]|uniref:Methyltransferase 13 n=1 Tax=Olea europaea subsp. europaea TaxID=158383 RepID=A0A8S0SC63_OLEEU|nr:methyltransferase-like protein 13 [Olea europaea var. sylvestris]CAA2988874.1 methyltransferase 13 [Olea europaea subsp. europaea]
MMTLEITQTQAYDEPWYRDNRHTEDPGPSDWYQNYPSLSPLLRLYIHLNHHRVLVVGCGNSAFSEYMVGDGYEDFVNIDISSVVIEAMQKKYSNRPHLTCVYLLFV